MNTKSSSKPALTVTIDAATTEIAQRYLGIETLERQGSDSLDFHSLGVANLRDALAAAYRAGMAHGRK